MCTYVDGIHLNTLLASIHSKVIPWCSGYHVSLTHSRSPVRSRAESLGLLFFLLLLFFLFFFFSINFILKTAKIFISFCF